MDVPLIARAGPELELLFRTARAASNAYNRKRICTLIESGINWQTFLAATERHYVAPLVHRTLSELALALPALPRKVVETLRVRTKITTWKNERFAVELVRLNAAFQSQGLEILNYKGAILAECLFGDISRRSFNDLDFLVRRRDLSRALEVLESEGYRNTLDMDAEEATFYESEQKEYLYTRGDFHVEPHWSLTARRYPFDLDYERLWHRAQNRLFRGMPIMAMSPQDDLHVLCLVGAKGWWKRFQMVSDIAQCIAMNPAIDWAGLLAEARLVGSERIVLLASLMAAELQDAPVPAQILVRARASGPVVRLARRIVATFVGPPQMRRFLPNGPHILRWDMQAMRERTSDRCKYLWRASTTPMLLHRRRFPLPKPLHWLYTLLVPAHDYLAYPLLALAREALRRARTIRTI